MKTDFKFGIETEFIIVNKSDFAPLSHHHLDFQFLLRLINSIPTHDVSKRGYDIKPLHTQCSPYLVEGYYLTDSEMKPVSLLPKGFELRTPICDSIEECCLTLQSLFERLRKHAISAGYDLVVLSNHPTESRLEAAPNYHRHDYWQWALTAATTFGPDINISVPDSLKKSIDLAKLAKRINYYMPSVVAMTLASPLVEGQIWRPKGKAGKSIRTFRRSIWAPLLYVHEKLLRFEFKGFEMSRCIDDYAAFFLLSLALLLDESLDKQASDEARIYELGQISMQGLDLPETREIASRVLESAEKTAARFGFRRDGLDEFWSRIQSRRLPADNIISIFEKEKSIPRTMSHLIGMYACSDFKGDEQTDFSPLPAVLKTLLTEHEI